MESGIKHKRGTGRERVYNFIVEFIKNNGYAPSVREICTGTDLSSTSSVYIHLLKLEEEGRIEMKRKSTRAIKVIGFSVREDGGIGIMGKGRPKVGVVKQSVKKTISKQNKKDLKVLADDFGLLYRADVKGIIENCKSYAEGQQKIMRVYMAVYLTLIRETQIY